MPPTKLHIKENGIEKKYCGTCKIYHSLDKFGYDKRSPDNLKTQCKDSKNKDKRIRHNETFIRMSPNSLQKSRHGFSEKMKTKVIVKNNIEGKICSSCKIWKSFLNYSTENKTYVDGSIKYKQICNDCRGNVRREQKRIKSELRIKNEQEEKERLLKLPRNNPISKFCEHDKYYFLCKNCFPHQYYEYYEKRCTRRKNDHEYRIKENLRHRLYMCVRRNIDTNSEYRSIHIQNLLGCTIEELMNHYEKHFIKNIREIDDIKLFEPMTMENYGRLWHTEHIIPCYAFDLLDPIEQKRCFNWRNLIPMFGRENCSKGSKYNEEDLINYRTMIDKILFNNEKISEDEDDYDFEDEDEDEELYPSSLCMEETKENN
jgi:hypothetical protein